MGGGHSDGGSDDGNRESRTNDKPPMSVKPQIGLVQLCRLQLYFKTTSEL